MTNNTPMVRLGELIEEGDQRNLKGNFGIVDVVGINIDKNFIPTVANLQTTDISKYKLVPPGYFACNLMHIGRDIRIPIAYNNEKKTKIVSPAYFVFSVKESKKEKVIDDYLLLLFRRYEFDRFCWFSTDCSIRGNLLPDRFYEIEIPLPSIETQRALVAIYNGLQQTIAENEALIRELESVCHAFIVDCKTKYPKVKLGEWIAECDERNSDNTLTLDALKGISTSKFFIETKANMNGVSLTSYKIVAPREFAYVADTSRRGDKIALALNAEKTNILISAIYTVFRSKDENILLPEYLFLFFNRTEFDRYSRFNSWGSARETFDFSEMRRVEIPLPPIEFQHSIADVYNCLQESKRIVQESRELMKELCLALVQKAAHSA